eukprot:4069660-Amphidinium_carterae.1
MEMRIVQQGREPYADFSVLTPYGRRMAKMLRHRSWLPQQDGTYRPYEAPGPGDFETWASCFKVFSAALLMLRFEADGVQVP